MRLAGERQNVINAQKDKQRVMVEVEHLRRKVRVICDLGNCRRRFIAWEHFALLF